MTIPSVMYIEMAKDTLKSEDPALLADELKEFNCLGPMRKKQIMESLAETFPGVSDMAAGYLLGVETARILLRMMPQAAQAGVTL